MKGVIITPDTMRVIKDQSEVVTSMTPGNLVDALWSASRWYDVNGCPALAEFYRDKATKLMQSKWYQDWSMSL